MGLWAGNCRGPENHFDVGKIVNMKKFVLISIIIFVSSFLLWQDVTLAGDQSRSTDFFIGDSDIQVSGPTDLPFSIYIGDNLLGVSTPVKAAYFTMTGVYTGGGALNVEINNDVATNKNYSLANVTKPTGFEIVYQDESNKINPLSPGNYNYTLNLVPSGVSISGLGVKMELTHQFAQTTCVDGATANQKIKTTDQFVGDSDVQVSGPKDLPFSLYIGDDLSGITDPVKSAYLTVTGLYAGGGNLDLKIDGNEATDKNYILPNVTHPTNFEILYKDDSNAINPQTAGSYNYTLNLNATGLTVSGLGVKITESHRYKPPACGASFPPFGDLISPTFDTTGQADGPAYNSILWQGSLGGVSKDQGLVRLQVAASDSSSGPWTYYGSNCAGGAYDWFEPVAGTPAPISCFNLFNNKRYLKYKLRICSNDCVLAGSYTPQVDDVVVSWSP